MLRKRGGGNVREAILTSAETHKTNQPVISSSCIHYLSVSQLNKTSSKQYWDSNSFLSCPVVPWFPGILNYIHYLNALGCQSGKYGIKEKKKNQRGEEKNTCVWSFAMSRGFFRDTASFPLLPWAKGAQVPARQKTFLCSEFLGRGSKIWRLN